MFSNEKDPFHSFADLSIKLTKASDVPVVISIQYQESNPDYNEIKIPTGSKYDFNLDTCILDIDDTPVQMGTDFKNQMLKALTVIGKRPTGNILNIHFLESVKIEINSSGELVSFPRGNFLEIIDPGEKIEKYDPERSECKFIKLGGYGMVYPVSQLLVFIKDNVEIEIPISEILLDKFGESNSRFEVKLGAEICVKLDKKTGDFIELVFPANIDDIELEISN